MRERIARLVRRTQGVYAESGSLAMALSFLGHSITAKAAIAATHARGRVAYMLPGRLAAETRRLDAIREDGRLAIAITVSGGVGDLIVIARCMRDLAAEVEPFSFDVFAPEPRLANWVFAAVPGFGNAFGDTLENMTGHVYDLRFRLNQTVVVHYESANWARIRSTPRVAQVAQRVTYARHRGGLDPYILHHPRLDNGLARKAVYTNRSRIDFLQGMAGLAYGGDRLDIPADDTVLQRFGLAGRPFITLHNGFDANFIISGKRATKCYPHFADVVAGLKAARPDLLVVQIGTRTSDPIACVDLNLIGKTNLREAAGLLRATTLHLDNEGGLVHLAACYGRRSLVVFGPTPSDYFGYPGNINVDPVRCGGCWWINEFWMDRCSREMEEPECMFAQPPETVIRLALAALEAGAESRVAAAEDGVNPMAGGGLA